MTKTELLARADRLDAHAAKHDAFSMRGDDEQRQWAADLRAQAALNRKLAALEPAAWSVVGSNLFCDGLYTRQAFANASASSRNDGSRVEPLHNLTGVLDE